MTMDFLRTLAASVAALLLRLLVVVCSLVFLASLVVAGLFVAVVLSVWALLRGRRPNLAELGRFRACRWRDLRARAGAMGRGRSSVSNEVIDVQAREVPSRSGDAGSSH
ncbi:MAG: hypothetical protein KatS3mg122_2541 [Caldimonas sp.]|uniref:hypothetical protein n=1 Tax=Caldimonas TaxID=196013 RepID=UPI0003709BB0|nr:MULTISPECIES: hypothetical protein [Caldimonas]GIX25310.1 MAG: hypothetical protein KatS3mg122_2541 [Caldimonas sp.]